MLLRYISYYKHENKLEVGNIEYLVPPIPPVILWSLLCVWWVLGVGTGHPLLTGPVCCLIVVSLPPIIATPGSARTVSCLITLTPWSSPRSECLLLVVCLSVCVCVRSGLVLSHLFLKGGWVVNRLSIGFFKKLYIGHF